MTAAQVPRRSADASAEPRPNASVPLDDAAISTAIRRKLDQDAAMNAAELRIVTRAGTVELTGTTGNLVARERAIRHAETIKGVRAVAAQIVVEPPQLDDKELARDVKNLLLANATTGAYDTDVVARTGVVRLEGTARSHRERLAVERVATGTRGIAALVNAIDLQPRLGREAARSDAEIAREVEERMRWDVLVDAQLVRAHVDGGRVRLAGVVKSAAEKRRAALDAWVAGVEDVDVSGIAVQWWARSDELRGEKYVVRHDVEVERALRSVLAADPRLGPAAVDATAVSGLLTLTGAVDSLEARSAAEQLAKHTVGVREVDNHVQVKPPLPLSDIEMQRRVTVALAVGPYTGGRGIVATVAGGTATLTGGVESFFERAEAEAVTAGVLGIRAIDNEISVAMSTTSFVFDPYLYAQYPYVPTPSEGVVRAAKADGELTLDIEAQLFWCPFLDPAHVYVSVNDGKTTLTGTVDSLRERSAATQIAYEGGSGAVENRLVVR